MVLMSILIVLTMLNSVDVPVLSKPSVQENTLQGSMHWGDSIVTCVTFED